MCEATRRKFLAGSAAFLMAATEEELMADAAYSARGATLDIDKVETIAPDIFFHEGDLGKGHCNNGWIVLEDYVLLIDANFPSGAQVILPKIRAITDKPIRFAFDTHHHGDHAYGNQFWAEQGAVPIAHAGVVEEMKKYETGYYGGKPGRWENSAKSRSDVQNSKLKPPSLLFPRELIFDDGKHHVELLYLGVAHTHGDAFAWLPKEKILFGGDACVNGPYNFVGDGNVEQWVKTLESAHKLGALYLCPGHGPMGSGAIVEDQLAFFKALREQVGRVMSRLSPEEAQKAVDKVREPLQASKQISRYVGNPFPAQAEKVYTEMTGKKFPASKASTDQARLLHAKAHGLA